MVERWSLTQPRKKIKNKFSNKRKKREKRRL